MTEPILCYIDGNRAYFTTQALAEQWGDDWDDAPFEHNAGPPYGPWSGDKDAWEITYIFFESDLFPPNYGMGNSPYSVQQINSGAVAWLKDPDDGRKAIFAGTPLNVFKAMIRKFGGKVFVEEPASAPKEAR